MAMYFDDGTLVFRKIDVIHDDRAKVHSPVYKEERNILEDLQNSYVKYLTKTIHEDVEYLEMLLNEYSEMRDVTVRAYVRDLSRQSYTKTQVNSAKMFWSVFVQFYRQGIPVGPEHELLRIPFMDAYGRLNIDGKIKSLVQEQRTAEDISFSIKGNTFNISTPTANIQVKGGNGDVKVKYGSRSYSLMEIILSMMYVAGDDTELSDIFVTTALLNKCKFLPHARKESLHRAFTSKVNILDAFASKQYVLGPTREAINEQLSLFNAVGERLSRDTLDYKKGTLITETMVSNFIYNRLHVVYVECFSIPDGYYFAQGYTPISFLPKGLPVTEFIIDYLPQYAQYAYLPEDVYIDDPNKVLVLDDSEPMKEKEVEFFRNMFPDQPLLVTAKHGSDRTIPYSFEREIIDNYTAKLKYLVDNVPSGRYADEWVYYYNNPNLDRVDDTHINCHDFIALLSLYGGMLATGKVTLYDRDTSYLKKVQGISETFSEHLRKVMKAYVSRSHGSIYNKISSGSDNNPMAWLTKEWLKSMYDSKVLATPDTLNIVAEISQVNHVTTLSKSNEIPDEQRQIAMPHYGRICPFETPAGKQLGLVNTKAVGARLRDGLLEVPYRAVKKYGTGSVTEGIYISDDIRWMTVKEETQYRFADMLSFKYDENGRILNTRILARVPNPEDSHEPFIFKNIMAYDMADNYVTAYPEQFLSPTACLVPFAGSDNVVRISFGLSQMKQAVYLLDSQVPLISTRMSKRIFDLYGTEESLAPVSGVIESILYPSQYVKIRQSNGEIFSYCLSSLSPQDPWFMHGVSEYLTFLWHVKVGDVVKECQSMATVVKQPQHYVVKAPMSGYIANIHGEMISIVDEKPDEFGMVNTDDDTGDTFPFIPVRITGQTITTCNLHVHTGQHVEQGQVLADTWASREGTYSPARHPLVAYFSNGYNYEDGVCATERGCVNYTSIITHKRDISVKKRKDKAYRASINSGMKYSSPGDPIGTIKASKLATISSEMAYDESSDIVVRATLKEQGIPFEVNTVEDTPNMRKYRFYSLGFNKLDAGDKMSGRHGNKGVVSAKILKNSEAPQLKNGKTVEFILSPLGVPSRMNLGQIWEAHLSLCAHILGVKMESEPYNGATSEEVTEMLQYTWQLANATAIGDNFTKQYSRQAFDAVCMAFPNIPSQVHEIAWRNIENIIDWRDSFNPDGTARLYDPITDSYLEGDVVIGFPEYFKLMQESSEKLNVRSGPLEEDYAQNSLQPAKNEHSAKGQRMGEMELVALASMGASYVIDEILNETGDNEGRRVEKHLAQLGLKSVLNPESCYARSTENTLYYCEGMGVQLDVPPNVANISNRATYVKRAPKLKHILKRAFGYRRGNRKESQSSDLSDVEDE